MLIQMDIRKTLSDAGYEKILVQNFGTAKDIMIQTWHQLKVKKRLKLEAKY